MGLLAGVSDATADDQRGEAVSAFYKACTVSCGAREDWQTETRIPDRRGHRRRAMNASRSLRRRTDDCSYVRV